MTRKILVADDNEGMRALLEYELIRRGFMVVLAKDGREAVEKARSEKPDLVLMDISMPAMDGTEAGELIKRQSGSKNIPVIFLTALISDTDGVKPETKGNSVVLPKAIKIGELLKYIESLIADSKSR